MHNPELWYKFEYILVGNVKHNYKNGILKLTDVPIYYSANYDDNIEQYPSLLTFTAWYLLANNDICKTDYVGIFEYDVIFKEYPNPELSPDTIYGFKQRSLPDGMYLDALPKLKQSLIPQYIKIAESQKYWNVSTNFIMSMTFLKDFSEWYYNFLFDINLISHEKHQHYHERLINYSAANTGYKNKTLDILEHKELNSHGIRL